MFVVPVLPCLRLVDEPVMLATASRSNVKEAFLARGV